MVEIHILLWHGNIGCGGSCIGQSLDGLAGICRGGSNSWARRWLRWYSFVMGITPPVLENFFSFGHKSAGTVFGKKVIERDRQQ